MEDRFQENHSNFSIFLYHPAEKTKLRITIMHDSFDLRSLTDNIALARGDGEADLLVKNCRLVNVLSGEIHEADVAVAGGVILGFGDYAAKETVDAQGRYMCPGLIDGHIHIESTLLTPREFAKAVAPHGTCAVMSDPHEIANVFGTHGVEFMLASAVGSPVSMYFMAPSCVPATHMESSGAQITAADISRLLSKYPGRLLGLAEVMNFPGVIGAAPDMLEKIMAARGKVIDGHAPMVSGKDLNAYILAGPRSDHECTDIAEAREKLRKGMHIMLREGSTERNLSELVSLVTPANSRNFSLVCDDRDPVDLKYKGHVNNLIRQAVSLGLDPVLAVQMGSINTARYFKLRNRGAVAPGYRADFLLVDDLAEFDVKEVYLKGKNINSLDFESGMSVVLPPSMHVQEPITPETFAILAGKGDIRVIGVVPEQIVTNSLTLAPKIEHGLAVADPSRDIAKLAVIERHARTGNVGLGFIQGLGLVKGALAATLAHDSHNLIVAGTNDQDMAAAARSLIECGGGLAIVSGGALLARVELPIAGLMSDQGVDEVEKRLYDLSAAYHGISSAPRDRESHPFMTLSFMALPVIPSLKLTDMGLVDVTSFSQVDLFTG